ncbi:MAG: UvrD-helicase domain-containing protein [Anaerolineae bacterium]
MSLLSNSGFKLTANQQQVVDFSHEGGESLYLHGLPGSGKTQALIARMLDLVSAGIRPDQIYILVSDRSQRELYETALARSGMLVSGGATITTFYGLCQRAVALFWQLVAGSAGFAYPEREPTFLTVESTQYYLARIALPLIQENGYFSDIKIRRERLLSQLIDNLNKSALVGFPPQEIANRLITAWAGSERRYASYQQAQDCALRFRQLCLQNSLLDLSLTVQLFAELIYPSPAYQAYISRHVRHLIVDNLEENVPVACDFIAWLRTQCRSSVLAEDDNAGYRVFLGADRQMAHAVGMQCEHQLYLERTPGMNPDPLTLANRALVSMHLPELVIPRGQAQRAVLAQCSERYWIGSIRWVANQIQALVEQGCLPGDIAVIAPYVSEVMRFALVEELRSRGIGLFLLRPATPLRDDVIIRAGLTLARLAHPSWAESEEQVLKSLPREDLAEMMGVVLADLDPLRARLLAEEALAPGTLVLADLSGEDPATAEKVGKLWKRLGFQLRERYELLRAWLADYAGRQQQPLDIFLEQIFGELLSLPGFGLYLRADLAPSYSRLVESAAKFRRAGTSLVDSPAAAGDRLDQGASYTALVLNGLASAEYVEDRPDDMSGAVILAPAFAYLTRGLQSRYQFWCDLRVDGWWNRPNQPLTHPFVLSRNWPVGQVWYDANEDQARREILGRILVGLAARCSDGIYLASSELGINGEEQSGRLERILQNALLVNPESSED